MIALLDTLRGGRPRRHDQPGARTLCGGSQSGNSSDRKVCTMMLPSCSPVRDCGTRHRRATTETALAGPVFIPLPAVVVTQLC